MFLLTQSVPLSPVFAILALFGFFPAVPLIPLFPSAVHAHQDFVRITRFSRITAFNRFSVPVFHRFTRNSAYAGGRGVTITRHHNRI
jgi:hypothetical protein